MDFLLGIFGLDVFFILMTFQMDLLVGIRLMILLLEQHGFFVFFLGLFGHSESFRSLVFSRHKSLPPKK